MKGFIDEIPKEYEDAALVDGYSRFPNLHEGNLTAIRHRHRRDRSIFVSLQRGTSSLLLWFSRKSAAKR